MVSPAGDPVDVVVLTRPEQVRAMVQPTRYQILGLLLDGAMTAAQIASRLQILKGSVTHHLGVLERAGLARVVRTARVRGGTERYWGRTAVAFAVRLSEAEPAGRADLLRTIATELAASPADRQSLLVKRLRLRPHDQERVAALIESLLQQVQDLAHPDGELLNLAVVRYANPAQKPHP